MRRIVVLFTKDLCFFSCQLEGWDPDWKESGNENTRLQWP